MRLETIELKNVGSYRDARIDLRQIAAAVITGQNGTGKSTGFIDAPLAAFFGAGRVSLDDLMTLGTDDLALIVTFRLNGQRYRVIRKRSKKTKAGKSELALQIAHGDGWEDASGARMQDTQDKICRLLNADYDLLVSTSFLVQGQADRFSRATSAERKAILAQILRLDQYAPLRQAATRQVAIAEAKAGEKVSLLKTVEAEAAALASLEARQAEVAGALTESQKAIEQLESHQQALTTKQARLTAELEQLQAIPSQIQALTARQTELRGSQQVKHERRQRAEKILANRTTIEAKVQEETQAKGLEILLDEERKALALDLADLTQRLTTVRAQLNEGVQLEREVAKAQLTVDTLVQQYAMETETLRLAIARDEQTCTMLTQVPCDAELQGRCQFTRQAVTVQQGLSTKRQLYANRYRVPGNDEQIAPEAVAARNVLAARLTTWTAQGHATAVHELETRQQTLQAQQQDCERRRQTCRDHLAGLAKFTSLVPELAAAERELQSVTQDLEQHAGELVRIETELTALATRQATQAQLQADHENCRASLQQDAIYLTRLRADSQTAIGRLKELELEIKRAQDAGRQAVVLQQEVEQFLIDVRQFQALAMAYTQIPVLIMETAIPLLEEEANRILGKISTSGMRVSFPTQKALKSRDGLAETLEIVVRDVFGERKLDNYSGGERARVDLAIRIGLSKLLATRAGSQLETLIVDEAFAAVDREGVEQLVECLPLLTQEFPLILFITHDESFKSAIAQQIMVTKTDAGSQVEVLS